MAANFPAYNGTGNFAFASYSHEDSGCVYPIIKTLNEMGYNIWYDEGIPLVVNYGGVLYRRIKDCSVFLLFVSKNSTASVDVDKEVENAFGLKKTVVRINIDDTQLPDSWAYHLPTTSQYISVKEESETFYSKLCNTMTMCRDEEQPQLINLSKIEGVPKSADDAVSSSFRNRRSLFREGNKGIIIKTAVVAAVVLFFVLTLSLAVYSGCFTMTPIMDCGLISNSDDSYLTPQENNHIESDLLSENDFSGIEVGDVITFGHFEQDNYSGNGAEEIEWRVLDVQENKALIISEYGLCYKPYNNQNTAVSWENCTLRDWMNSTFYDKAFSESEKNMILLSDISNDNNSKYQTNAGRDTKDRIFCLSLYEAKHYFANDVDRMCRATDYAYATCEGSANGGIECWWLRTPGKSTSTAAYVKRRDGDCSYDGLTVMDRGVIARPAMWIEID